MNELLTIISRPDVTDPVAVMARLCCEGRLRSYILDERFESADFLFVDQSNRQFTVICFEYSGTSRPNRTVCEMARLTAETIRRHLESDPDLRIEYSSIEAAVMLEDYTCPDADATGCLGFPSLGSGIGHRQKTDMLARQFMAVDAAPGK